MTVMAHAFNDETHFKSLICRIGLPLKNLSPILNLSPSEVLNWWSGQSSLKIEDQHFTNLADFLSLNENDIHSGEFDTALARERAIGNNLSLPEKYSSKQNSFVRTSEHIYKYLVLTRGQYFTDQILRELNVSPNIYLNPECPINMTYFGDLLLKLSEKGLTPLELDTLGSVIFLSVKKRPWGLQMQNAEDLHDVYKIFSSNYGYFDSNFDFKAEFIGKKCFVTTSMSLEGHPDLYKDQKKMALLLRYRQIVLAWIPYLAGRSPRFPQTESVIVNDVVKIRYELRLEDAAPKQPSPNLRLLQLT